MMVDNVSVRGTILQRFNEAFCDKGFYHATAPNSPGPVSIAPEVENWATRRYQPRALRVRISRMSGLSARHAEADNLRTRSDEIQGVGRMASRLLAATNVGKLIKLSARNISADRDDWAGSN
jgi:hypothetical protein